MTVSKSQPARMWVIGFLLSLLEFETQLCEDFGNLANHGFPPPPHSCVPFYESSVFLFASVSDRMSTVCPEKKDFFTRPLLQKGSSLQEEILSVCLYVCLCVRNHFFYLQIFNNLMI